MGAFFHAVAVFIHHLRQVEWTPLGLALACHVAKLLFRGRAWQNIIRAAYPGDQLKYRSALGVYVAASWPLSSFWVLGTVVAVEIIARGITLVAASWVLRDIEHHGGLPGGFAAV